MAAPAQNLSRSRIDELIDQRQWTSLRMSLRGVPVADVVDLLGDLDKRNRAVVFRLLPRQLSAEVLSSLEPESRDALLKDLTEEETRELLANMSPDDRTHLLEELPGQATQRLLNLLGPEDLREARQLLGYPEDSVGRLMTPNYVAVRPSWTIRRALQHIRDRGADSQTTDVIYVTDESWRLIDALELRKFVLAGLLDTVERIMDRSFVSVSAFDDREESVRLIQRYDLAALPVVDSEGVLIGVVTVDDVLDVAQEEATEDFQKVGAVAPLGVSYQGWFFGMASLKESSGHATVALVPFAAWRLRTPNSGTPGFRVLVGGSRRRVESWPSSAGEASNAEHHTVGDHRGGNRLMDDQHRVATIAAQQSGCCECHPLDSGRFAGRLLGHRRSPGGPGPARMDSSHCRRRHRGLRGSVQATKTGVLSWRSG